MSIIKLTKETSFRIDADGWCHIMENGITKDSIPPHHNISLMANKVERSERELSQQSAREKDLVEALRSFAHPDLCKEVTGNVSGDTSPIFGRDKAIITLGDTRRAAKALAPYKEKET